MVVYIDSNTNVRCTMDYVTVSSTFLCTNQYFYKDSCKGDRLLYRMNVLHKVNMTLKPLAFIIGKSNQQSCLESL